MKNLAIGLLIALGMMLGMSSAVIAQNFDDVKIKATEINGGVYMLEGAGGNIGVFVGEEGTLMIDSQFSEVSDKIKTAVMEISDHNIKYLVNTHFHGDHTGGNADFAKDGATIIATHKVRERLSNDNVRPFGGTTPAVGKEKWPSLSFGEDMQIHMNGESIQLFHVHNAHTDGDALVYFPKANVLHMGDCFFNKRFPYIDVDMGGSVQGALEAMEAAMMVCNSETKIIPGHGPLASLKDLKENYSMVSELKRRVESQMKDATKVEDLVVSTIIDGYEDYEWQFINGQKIVKAIYTSIQREFERQ